MGEISELARQWIDRAGDGNGVTGTWRLEILQKRLAADRDGAPREGKEIPVRIRRFLKGIPWAQVHDAIRYLISKSPYDDVICNGLRLEGRYRPTLTQWRRDDQEQVGGNAQGSYTLIQDLIEVTEGGDTFDVATSDSCSETVETKWVWDSPEIEELPYSSEQGVTYAIQQVRRNDDGTFDYAVVRRAAKTQVSDETVVQCDEYETVYATVYDNVYGGEGGEPFRDDAGNPVALPQPCEDREAGVLIQVQKSQNPDCTFRITVQRTVSRERVQATETAKTLKAVQKTTVTRNNDAKAPETGLGVGDRVRNELQPDGRYTTTVVRTSGTDVGETGHECSRTVFEHAHSDTMNVVRDPGPETEEAGGGITRRKTVRMTEEGTYDVVEETTEELDPGEPAIRSVRRTLRGDTETTVYRNVSDRSVEVSGVGDETKVELTPGGKVTRTVTKASTRPAGDISSDCRTTVFEHRDSLTSNRSDATVGDHAPEAGGGVVHERTVRMTEEGTYDVIDTKTVERPVSGAVVVKRKTLRGVTESVTHRNVEDGTASVSDVGDEVRVETTPGGRYDRTETRVVPEAAGEVLRGCSDVSSRHDDTSVENLPVPAEGHVSAGVNEERSVESRKTEEGTYDVTTRQTVFRQELRFKTSPVAKVQRWDETVESHQVANSVEPPTDIEEGDGEAIQGASAGVNGHGSVDGSWQVRKAGEFFKWDAECSVGRDYVRTVWFRHATEQQYKALFKEEADRFKDRINQWVKAERHPGSTSVSPSVTPEEYKGRFSGQISTRASWAATSAGMDDEIEIEEIFSYWWDNSVESKVRTPARGSNGEIKYYAPKYDSHNWFRHGRGWKSCLKTFLEFTRRSNCDTGGVSVNFDPETKAWSVSAHFNDNQQVVEHDNPT